MNGWTGFLADLAFLRALADDEEMDPIDIERIMMPGTPFRSRELRDPRGVPFPPPRVPMWPKKRVGSPFPEEVGQPGGPQIFHHPDLVELISMFLTARIPAQDLRAFGGGVLVSARSANKAKRAFARMVSGT